MRRHGLRNGFDSKLSARKTSHLQSTTTMAGPHLLNRTRGIDINTYEQNIPSTSCQNGLKVSLCGPACHTLRFKTYAISFPGTVIREIPKRLEICPFRPLCKTNDELRPHVSLHGCQADSLFELGSSRMAKSSTNTICRLANHSKSVRWTLPGLPDLEPRSLLLFSMTTNDYSREREVRAW